MGSAAKGLYGAGLAAVLLWLAGCGQSAPAPGCGELSARDAWVTPAHPGSREMLGFATLHNGGRRAVVIEQVLSEQFDRAVFQNKAAAEQSADDESGGAQPMAPFTIESDQMFELTPEGREIALYSPTRAYETGDQVTLTLVCGADNARLSVPAVVRSGQDVTSLPPTDDDTMNTERALTDGRSETGVSASDDSRTAN